MFTLFRRGLLGYWIAGVFPVTGETDATELQLGDERFEHEYLHPFYQKFFADGQCPCSVGECRPTLVRSNPAIPDTGMEVLVDRLWYPVPRQALQPRTALPSELLEYSAHVCARIYYFNGNFRPIIECVIFNGAI